MKWMSIVISSGLLMISQQSVGQDMSGWSDKTVCRLVEQHGKVEFIDEAKSRGLGCVGDVSGGVTKISQIAPEDRVITSTDQRFKDMCHIFDSNKVKQLSRGIFLLPLNTNYSNIGLDLMVDLYNDGDYEASAIQISYTPKRYHAQNIKFYSENAALNTDNKLGMVFKNEQPKSREIRKVISGDLNADGQTDMVFIDYGEHDGSVKNGKIISLISSADGYEWSEMKSVVSKNVRFHTGVLIDIDNDNDLDIVAGGRAKKSWKKPYFIHIFENDGKGNFKSKRGPNVKTTRIGGGWIGFTSSDVDDDGYHDLIMDWQKPYEGEHGTQIVWGKERGLFKSLKISRLFSEHLSNKDILMDAITIKNDEETKILATYAADDYQNGTKIVEFHIDGRKVISSDLILHRSFHKGSSAISSSVWINTVYPCASGMRFLNYASPTKNKINTN